ncbi:MAG: hypothetical protein M3O25_01595 [Actinomycetota bacterium]|nr:hypothetical protein [Actinomycetota bacterium]
MNLPDRAASLERERRWMRPAGIASILGVLLLAAGLALRITSLNADGAADALLKLYEDDLGGRLVIGAVLSALGFLCFGVTLTHLFLAARARSERVRSGMVGLTVIGVVFLAVGGVIGSLALSAAADDFGPAEAEGERTAASDAGAIAEAETKEAASAELGAAQTGAQPTGGNAQPGKGETTVEATTTTPGETSTGETSTSDSADPEEDADDRAEDAIQDASGYGIGGIMGLVGTLGFAIGYFYTSLWSMRAGLLTRFWGSLGMACSVVFVLLAQGAPEILFFQELWFLATGLMLLGFWVGGRPPAWEAGHAIPWTRPGQEAAQGIPDAVEGEGRDVTGEPPDPGEPDDGSENGSPPSDPPRKRKRRT